MLLLLLSPAVVGLAQSFKLPGGQGRLEIYPVGEWQIRGEDVGEFRILIVPKDERANATATLHVAMEGADEFPTQEKLARQVAVAMSRILDAGSFVEKKPHVKPFYREQGFGYYSVLTDAKLVGRPKVLNDFKQVCLGLIRLKAGMIVRVQIMADGEETPEFQQLLGMMEGMTLKGR